VPTSNAISPPPELFGGRLTIDLEAIAANWTFLDGRLSGSTECAAAIKGDGYGTGQEKAAPALFAAGCRTFFTAVPTEAIALREILPDAVIYVLDGLFPGTAEYFPRYGIRPVLASVEELKEWSAFCKAAGKPLEAAVHVDTGIHRLGLSPEEFSACLSDPDLVGAFTPSLIMSHLACGSTPAHEMNRRQLNLFSGVTAPFAHIPRSLANSAGILMGPEFHFDLVRPGILTFGVWPMDQQPDVMPVKPVLRWETSVIVTRELPAGHTIGYGRTFTAPSTMRLAILPVGYADGYPYSCGNKAEVLIRGQRCQVVGAVSMDQITVDITHIPEVRTGERATLIGRDGSNAITVRDVADWAGTIPYVVLTSIGSRVERVYTESEATPR